MHVISYPKKGFYQQCNLKRHMSSHTVQDGGEGFACAHCPATFTTKSVLSVHMRDAHGEKTKKTPEKTPENNSSNNGQSSSLIKSNPKASPVAIVKSPIKNPNTPAK
jgi:hypothetical protein